MPSTATHAGTPLVVHSHLRWDFVWQRPQQLMSRFAERSRILFVEEPVYADDIDAATLDVTVPVPRVHRVVPKLPGALRGQYDESIAVIRELLRTLIGPGGSLADHFARPIHWFYTPMPAPAMIGAFNESSVVYDCMDELSKFRFAPSELTDREAYLMAEADVVFAGGHKLAQAKSRRHANVHFFGCGVDVAHFSSARLAETTVPPDIARLSGTVAGYYGVIDERIDYPLLSALAAAMPELQVVMVGPVVKVHPDELPQAPNIHWLGQRSYDELPAIVKGFGVCLMPFARNEATEYINPTKTLEYMAAAKPVVSTDIPDVVSNFTPVVAVARGHDEFIRAVRAAITNPAEAILERGVEQARQNSWESIVFRMQRIMSDATFARAKRQFGEEPRADRAVSRGRMVRERIVAPENTEIVA